MDVFHDFVMSHPRPFPAQHIESHLNQLDEATRIQRQLEAWTTKPVLYDIDIMELGVVRAGTIDINNPSTPITDYVSRCFRPDTIHVAIRRAIRWNDLKAWPSLDAHHSETFGVWGGHPIPIDTSLMDSITQTVVKCLRLTDWEVHKDSPERRASLDEPSHLYWVKSS